MKSSVNNEERARVSGQAIGEVLEIGFGSGLNIPYYKNIKKLYALDPSLELFLLARERIGAAMFPVNHIRAMAENIPLPDNSVDTVVSTWSLCSIPKPDLALKEVRRVLKTDGKFIFVEHGKSPKGLISFWQKLLTPVSKCLAGGCHLDRNIKKLISDAGFEIITLQKYARFPKLLNFIYSGVAKAKI